MRGGEFVEYEEAMSHLESASFGQCHSKLDIKRIREAKITYACLFVCLFVCVNASFTSK